MAFTRKKKRRIVVRDQEYFWSATGDDGWINLRVMTDVDGGQQLSCTFDYHQDRVPHPSGGVALRNQFVVTPYIVRPRAVCLSARERRAHAVSASFSASPTVSFG